MRKRNLWIVITFLLVFFLPGAGRSSDREQYPFYPSLLNTKTGGPVSSSEYENPRRCKICHGPIYRQWNGSMHSNALKDPVFQALWVMADKETNGATRNFCAGCHTPIGTVGEEVTLDAEKGIFTAGTIASRGVQCDFCHTVSELTWKDTSVMQPHNAAMIMDPGDVKRGPYKDSDSPGHDTAYSQLHTSAEFCGSCHNVFHPGTGVPLERTYEEWRISVYAGAGIVCQDCHMMPLEKAIEVAATLKKPINPGKASPLGPERDNVYTHEFVGGNFTVTALLGADSHAALARSRLKSAAVIKLLLPDRAVSGKVARFKVEVFNVGAGHNLPTSLTEVRQMWLDVTVKDPKGNVLYRSGALDEKGDIDPDANIFHAVAVDKDGKVTYKPWAISHFSYVRTIPPKGSDVSDYAFLVPPKLKKGELVIDAVLHYRSLSQELADTLLGEGTIEVPVVDMAAARSTLELSRK